MRALPLAAVLGLAFLAAGCVEPSESRDGCPETPAGDDPGEFERIEEADLCVPEDPNATRSGQDADSSRGQGL